MFKIRSLFLILGIVFTSHVHGNYEAAITTIPKSGTCLFLSLLVELQVPVPCSHYTEFPEGFPTRTVVVVRDLRDVMVSAVFWCEKLAKLAIQGDERYAIYIPWSQEFLTKSDDEKLLEVILSANDKYEGEPSFSIGTMNIARHACDLALKIMKGPPDSFFVIRFEDIIGADVGGRLEDSQRWELLSQMFEFLGYEILPETVETGLANIFATSQTYNPVKKKVGRWTESFKQEHEQAFLEHWGAINAALGYDNF